MVNETLQTRLRCTQAVDDSCQCSAQPFLLHKRLGEYLFSSRVCIYKKFASIKTSSSVQTDLQDIYRPPSQDQYKVLQYPFRQS